MKRKSLIKKLLIAFCVLVLISVTIVSGTLLYINSKLNKISTTTITKNLSELGIHADVNKINKQTEEDYVNILLLGIDTRDYSTDPGRSDCTMILTIDKKHKKIKVTSILRDSIETMAGHGPMQGKNQDRLNHAYAYGGPLLAIKTVNENYDMNIKDYVKVDFQGLQKIIDALGGVSISITQAEIPYINAASKASFIKKPGTYTINGAQALGYSRLRYVGGDFERTERQRVVLDQIFKKITSKKLTEMPDLLNSLLPYVETSLSKQNLLDLTSFVLVNKVTSYNELRLPIDNSYKINTSVNNTYFVIWDVDKNVEALHRFIYEEDDIPTSTGK